MWAQDDMPAAPARPAAHGAQESSRCGRKKRRAGSYPDPTPAAGRQVRTRAWRGAGVSDGAASERGRPRGSAEPSDGNSIDEEDDDVQDDPCALTSSVSLMGQRVSAC